MREVNDADIKNETDKIFKWMVFQNGGFWMLVKDFFTRKRVGWWNYLLKD